MRLPNSLGGALLAGLWLAAAVLCASAQTNVPTAPVGKTVFRDSDGNLVSNNEFVDVRMANFNYPDATVVRTLPDGTVEFRLQKVPQEGMRAAEFAVKTLDGRTIRSSELK